MALITMNTNFGFDLSQYFVLLILPLPCFALFAILLFSVVVCGRRV